MAPLHCWVLAHNRHNWGHMTHLKCCRPGPRLWEMLQSLEAACWHCQLPVRTDENWQRKHRPGPGTGHWPSQGHRAVCGVVWAEFLRNHGQKMCSGFRVYHLCCQICPACHALGQKSETKNSSASSLYPPPPNTTPPNNLLPVHIDACPRQPIIKYFYRYI